VAGHRGHKPGASSRAFRIHGTQGDSRRRRALRSAQEEVNDELRTLRCRGCGAMRKKGSGPFCANCSASITERN
jgi:hypothetical protein